jgi:CTD nuclear envelope phosphatase 1
MNSLNIISARVSPSSSPAPTRSNSLTHVGLALSPDEDPTRSDTALDDDDVEKPMLTAEPPDYAVDDHDDRDFADEKDSLLGAGGSKDANVRSHSWHVLPSRLVTSLINSLRWVLSTIAAPGVYLIAWLYDEQGYFAPLRHLCGLFGHKRNARKYSTDYHDVSAADRKQQASRRGSDTNRNRPASTAAMRPIPSSGSSSSGLSSDSESEAAVRGEAEGRTAGSSGRHLRNKSTEEIAPARRSIRIKLHSDDALRQRKQRKAQATNAKADTATELSAQLKSPTSPVGALTKYPKTPAPPRPLIPRRQDSYIPYENPDPSHLKTLILDLDETLIHSMSKGGKMGSGHMVEVRLSTTYVGAGGSQTLGPQHPILYYVHKRPHCDEFLRKVRICLPRATAAEHGKE